MIKCDKCNKEFKPELKNAKKKLIYLKDYVILENDEEKNKEKLTLFLTKLKDKKEYKNLKERIEKLLHAINNKKQEGLEQETTDDLIDFNYLCIKKNLAVHFSYNGLGLIDEDIESFRAEYTKEEIYITCPNKKGNKQCGNEIHIIFMNEMTKNLVEWIEEKKKEVEKETNVVAKNKMDIQIQSLMHSLKNNLHSINEGSQKRDEI